MAHLAIHSHALKKVLYFFPLNPADRNSGSISRALSLLRYFKARNMQVDFMSKQHWGQYTEQSKAAFLNTGLAENIHVVRRKPIKKNPITYFFGYKIGHLIFERKLATPAGSIPNHTTLHLRRQFDKLLKAKKYDYVIISYAYWADLVRDNPNLGEALTVMDTHDLLSTQHEQDPGFNREVALTDELRRLDLFQQIWAISVEEQRFFQHYFGARVKWIPMMMDKPVLRQGVQKKYDLIYVATDNPHNLAASEWFFREVYPLLDAPIRLCVIGTIIPHISVSDDRLEKIAFAESLTPLYEESRIAICPMLSGTGLKIKVVEALAHGLPVVCTEKGMDGLPEKTNNGCTVAIDARSFAAAIQRLLSDEVEYRSQSQLGIVCFEKNFETGAVYKMVDEALNVTPDEKN